MSYFTLFFFSRRTPMALGGLLLLLLNPLVSSSNDGAKLTLYGGGSTLGGPLYEESRAGFLCICFVNIRPPSPLCGFRQQFMMYYCSISRCLPIFFYPGKVHFWWQPPPNPNPHEDNHDMCHLNFPALNFVVWGVRVQRRVIWGGGIFPS